MNFPSVREYPRVNDSRARLLSDERNLLPLSDQFQVDFKKSTNVEICQRQVYQHDNDKTTWSYTTPKFKNPANFLIKPRVGKIFSRLFGENLSHKFKSRVAGTHPEVTDKTREFSLARRVSARWRTRVVTRREVPGMLPHPWGKVLAYAHSSAVARAQTRRVVGKYDEATERTEGRKRERDAELAREKENKIDEGWKGEGGGARAPECHSTYEDAQGWFRSDARASRGELKIRGRDDPLPRRVIHAFL